MRVRGPVHRKAWHGAGSAAVLACCMALPCGDVRAEGGRSASNGSEAADAADTGSGNALSLPAFSPTLKPNPNPAKIDLGPFGPIYATGVVSGLGLNQDHPATGDRRDRLDLSNAQMVLQKQDGLVQFFVQGGVYKQTALGLPDHNTLIYTRGLYGPAPVAFLKLAPNDSVSIQAGKLYTLLGPESAFTFQNPQIQRGLLFNQTNTVTRGVQANVAEGPLTVSVSFNDGFYSDRYNWVTGLATYKLDDENTLAFNAGANLGRTSYQSFAAPLGQNNSSIYDLVYTYSSGPWTVTPYVQYSNVPRDAALGFATGASAYGAAILASYAFSKEFALAGRAEYIAQTGSRFATGAPNLVFGPGSSAASLTVTPTFQRGPFFIRGECAYVKALDVAPGLGFGRGGSQTSQNRYLLETGITF